jgi:transcriptional regulator with XRE-family HTH domain
MSTTFGARLQSALGASNKSRASLAKVLRSTDGSLGISASAIGQTINGQTNAMTAENTLRAARFLNVSAYWLATGEGAMHDVLPLHTAVAEGRAAYWTPRDVLERMAKLLGDVPPVMRPAFADILRGWAADGGAPDRVDALLALIALPSR